MQHLLSYETQLRDLAERLGVRFLDAVDEAGVARSTIFRVERGDQRLTWKSAAAIEAAIRALSKRRGAEAVDDTDDAGGSNRPASRQADEPAPLG